MSPISSKDIVITYPCSERPGGISSSSRKGEMSVYDSFDFDSDDSIAGGPRKRRRLTHLTPDEKLLRRKLKNRVAAQTARDRKKALMVELEDKLTILEDENRLLKQQNHSLMQASSLLAKENASLKSQLASKSLFPSKTDSATKRSAAPEFPLQKERVQNLLREEINYAITPDNFLGLLQELEEDCNRERSQTPPTSHFSHTAYGTGSSPDGGIRTNCRMAPSGMVGLTPTELESLSELISIDHVYVKPQAHCQQRSKEEQPKSTSVTQGNSSDIISSQSYSFSNSRITHTTELNYELGSSDQIGHSADIKVNRDFTLSSLSSAPSLLPLLDSETDTDDLISLLSESVLQTTLNFTQDFNCPMLDLNRMQNYQKGSCNVKDVVGHTGELSDQDKDPEKLFNEIHEHYMSMRYSQSPDIGALSDSGVSSHLDAVSPQSGGESLHDITWHETSFADLFPDLQ